MLLNMDVRQDGAWLVAGSKAGVIYILDSGDFAEGFVDIDLDTTDGRRFLGTFGTLEDVAMVMERWRSSGESLNGRYFWMTDLVLVDVLNAETIVQVVEEMAATGEIPGPFTRARRITRRRPS
jgi:hypothetical protein